MCALSDLREGEAGEIEELALDHHTQHRLMHLGFLPGVVINPTHSGPGGEPRVYQLDGAAVALRRETASRIVVRPLNRTGLGGRRPD